MSEQNMTSTRHSTSVWSFQATDCTRTDNQNHTDRAVYKIFSVCDKDNVSSLRTLLGLRIVSNLVKNRHAKFPDGLLDTGSAALMHIHYINCLG